MASPPSSGTSASLLDRAIATPSASGPGAWILPPVGSTTVVAVPSDVSTSPDAASKTTAVSPTTLSCGSASEDRPSISRFSPGSNVPSASAVKLRNRLALKSTAQTVSSGPTAVRVSPSASSSGSWSCAENSLSCSVLDA